MTSVDLTDTLVETVRSLDKAVARWAGDQDRSAAAEAIEGAELVVAQSHRVGDALVAEVRSYHEQHRPYDPRD